MNSFTLIDPWYYPTAYHFVFLFICWAYVLYYIGSNQQKILNSGGSASQGAAVFLTIILILFFGLRPVSGVWFGDMGMYAHSYNNTAMDSVPIGITNEWLWYQIAATCKSLGFNDVAYFFVISAGYFIGMFICSLLLTRKNLWLSLLFFYISFSTYSYAVNGIRNGLACSFELVAIALISIRGRSQLALSLIFMFLALGIHRTTMLPSAAAIASVFVIKDTKVALRFWIASIFISLAAGPVVEQFFSLLGFDDRMGSYSGGSQDEQTMSQFAHTGFRFDFLFYSMWGAVMIWYVTKYRHFTDKTYTVIANTYLLCNAFWIMVIRASFSNRFAYLSWFMYPLVIVYPLLRMNIWKDQDRKTALIFFLYSGFTFFMFFIYYFGSMDGFRGFNLYWWR